MAGARPHGSASSLAATHQPTIGKLQPPRPTTALAAAPLWTAGPVCIAALEGRADHSIPSQRQRARTRALAASLSCRHANSPKPVQALTSTGRRRVQQRQRCSSHHGKLMPTNTLQGITAYSGMCRC